MIKLRKKLIILISSLLGINILSCDTFVGSGTDYGAPRHDYEPIPDEDLSSDPDINDDYDENSECPMYGCRSVKFLFSGKIKDAESNPISGIKVTLPLNSWGDFDKIDSTTQNDGSFSISSDLIVSYDYCVEGFGDAITLEDVDGVENGGEFISKEYTLKPVEVQGPDHCGFGAEFEEKDIAITLEKKSE